MSRIITFSTIFPSYHPRKGESTCFVEKFWASLVDQQIALPEFWSGWNELNEKYAFDASDFDNLKPKHHTIRAGKRWKAGDIFSPRFWGNDINPKSGKRGAYHSKQIVIAPDTEVKKTWDFKIMLRFDGIVQPLLLINDKPFLEEQQQEMLAENDGLSLDDLQEWFIPFGKKFKPFEGQIISWNEKIAY